VRDGSSYIDRTRRPLRQLEKTAWLITPRRPKRQAGFVSPKERPDKESEIESILDQQEGISPAANDTVTSLERPLRKRREAAGSMPARDPAG
jgi:hypothetical protein